MQAIYLIEEDRCNTCLRLSSGRKASVRLVWRKQPPSRADISRRPGLVLTLNSTKSALAASDLYEHTNGDVNVKTAEEHWV